MSPARECEKRARQMLSGMKNKGERQGEADGESWRSACREQGWCWAHSAVVTSL